jgi:hypothetical protein
VKFRPLADSRKAADRWRPRQVRDCDRITRDPEIGRHRPRRVFSVSFNPVPSLSITLLLISHETCSSKVRCLEELDCENRIATTPGCATRKLHPSALALPNCPDRKTIARGNSATIQRLYTPVTVPLHEYVHHFGRRVTRQMLFNSRLFRMTNRRVILGSIEHK